MSATNYNAWRWGGASFGPSLSSLQTASTSASHYATTTASSSSQASTSTAPLMYSETGGTGAFGGGTASISGLVYYDSNQNGQLDASEWGIPDAKIALSKVGSSDPAVEVLSGQDGSFKFGGLPAGTYTMTMLTPSCNPGQDALGVVCGKDGVPLADGAGTISPNTFSNIVLKDGYAGYNYLFAENVYPVSLISKRMLLNSDPRLVNPKLTEVVPEPTSLLMLVVGMLAMSLQAFRRRR